MATTMTPARPPRPSGKGRRPKRAAPVPADVLDLFSEGSQHTATAPDRPTLEDVISGVWEGLSGHAAVECLVCEGAMTPRYAAGAAVVGGRCSSCGTAVE